VNTSCGCVVKPQQDLQIHPAKKLKLIMLSNTMCCVLSKVLIHGEYAFNTLSAYRTLVMASDPHMLSTTLAYTLVHTACHMLELA